jgi:hypothetical protein
VFEGTPEEFTLLQRQCLEDKGYTTGDDPLDGVGFTYELKGVDSEQLGAAIEQCAAQLGEPKMADLSDAELRVRYEARVEQFQCLTENGLTDGEPPSFEVFVERYNRSGQKELWEPTAGAATLTRSGVPLGPTDVCPRSGESW